MAKVRGKSTSEFERRAVAMTTDQGLSVAEVSRRLGISESRLREWKKLTRGMGADAFPRSWHQPPAEEELRRLRADVERLERERDILKRATAFFAALSK